MNTSNIWLCRNVGISQGHYIYFGESQDSVLNYFKSKSYKSLENYAFVRGEKASKHGFNTGCVHINLHYSDCFGCEYVAVENFSTESTVIYGMVIDIEYVNEESTRIYFAIDYVATHWENCLQNMGVCLVERTHDKSTLITSNSNNENFIPESIAVNKVLRPDMTNVGQFCSEVHILNDMFLNYNGGKSKAPINYTSYPIFLNSNCNLDGRYGNMNFTTVGGVPCGAYTNTFTSEDELAKRLNTFVTFSKAIVSNSSAMAGMVNDIYIHSGVIGMYKGAYNKYGIVNLKWFLINNFPYIENLKTLQFIDVKLSFLSQSMTFNVAKDRYKLNLRCSAVGSPDGCATIYKCSDGGGETGEYIQTPTWPKLNVAGIYRKTKMEINL